MPHVWSIDIFERMQSHISYISSLKCHSKNHPHCRISGRCDEPRCDCRTRSRNALAAVRISQTLRHQTRRRRGCADFFRAILRPCSAPGTPLSPSLSILFSLCDFLDLKKKVLKKKKKQWTDTTFYFYLCDQQFFSFKYFFFSRSPFSPFVFLTSFLILTSLLLLSISISIPY